VGALAGERRDPVVSRMRAHMTTVPADIFKAYDIRGLYPQQIDGELAELIGGAFARVLSELSGKPVGELRVGLGRDMRLSAPELAGRYREGLLKAGASVIDAGQVGSEMLYFLVGSRELDGGLMCTASHNPKAYTGAKLVREGAIALSGDTGIQDIRRQVEDALSSGAGTPGTPDPQDPPDPQEREDTQERQHRGQLEEVELYGEFQRRALSVIDPEVIRTVGRPLKVVVDGGNGMAGPMVGPLLRELGLELIETYWTPDGEFPDHEPNPLLEENRRFIVEQVRSSGADLGIAWDGDADRCFFIDDTGAFVDGDFLTALLAESLLKKNPGEAILYDVRASRAVADTVTRAGGTPFMNRVGHAFFKTRMRKEGSLFGGEVSGHYYFRDFYCADSGTLPALLVLELLCGEGVRMSELLKPYRERYFISGEINSEVSEPAAKMEEIAERYADARQERLDGISIDYEDWHFNVRMSNTEPLLRLCLESLVSREDMERRRDEVLALIRSPAGDDAAAPTTS
jgi:phosphomannomutase